MPLKLCFTLAIVAALRSAAAAEPDAPKNSCPEGRVQFQGHVVFEDNQKPLQVSPDALLKIEVAEDVPSGAAPAPAVFSHDVNISNYSLSQELQFFFCADLSSVTSRKVSLKAHMVDQAASDKVEYMGETVVPAGSKDYEADITLAKLEVSAASEPSVADCQFGQMAEDVAGVAVRAAVRINLKSPLPRPTVLSVTLIEKSADSEEPEVISVFSGDVSNLYEPGKPLPAFLCAKVPNSDASATYTIDASVHVGWDGLESPDAEDRTPRLGDYVISKRTPVVFTEGQSDYTVEVEVKPYRP